MKRLKILRMWLNSADQMHDILLFRSFPKPHQNDSKEVKNYK